jgi:hypothetical protein
MPFSGGSETGRLVGQQAPPGLKETRFPDRQNKPEYEAILALQRSAGNAAVAQFLANRRGALGHTEVPSEQTRPLVIQRCGSMPCDCSKEEGATPNGLRDLNRGQELPIEQRRWSRESSSSIDSETHRRETALGAVQRVAGVDDAAEAGAAWAVLWHCITGMLVTLALDEALQGLSWLWKGGEFRQNWCKTVISALFGCVFGVAGGAFERIFFQEAGEATGFALLNWLQKKAAAAGYTFVAGKMAQIIAKAGCTDVQVTELTPIGPDDAAAQLAVLQQTGGAGDGETQSDEDQGVVA